MLKINEDDTSNSFYRGKYAHLENIIFINKVRIVQEMAWRPVGANPCDAE